MGNVLNCNFMDNSASDYGGAIRLHLGTVVNCNFTNNKARSYDSFAGAVFIYSGTVENCNFINNSAKYGGAVYFDDNGCELRNCNFANNSATGFAGAVYVGGDCTATNCNFTNNSAIINGGAVHFEDNINGAAVNCNFANNKANGDDGYGGAIYFSYNTISSVTNCNFTNNSATGWSGAIYFNYYTTGNVTNCIFTNNSAIKGGAISNNSNLNVTSSRFEYNVASDEGGAIYSDYQANMVLSNSVFQNNKAKSNSLTAVNSTGNCPIVTITFSGNERWINAISAYDVTFSNVEYWNGAMVNSDVIAPTINTYPGISIVVEVYDSTTGRLVDNVTLVTNDISQAVYDSVKLDAGIYRLNIYHPDDNYYTGIESNEVLLNVIKNSSLVTIKIDDNANFTYGKCNISFEVINRTTVRVVITNKTGEVLFNQTTDENFTVVDLLPGDYNITVYNEANELYSSSMDSKLFTIWKVNSTMVILPFEDPIYGNEFEITFDGDNITSINATIYDKDNNIVFTEILEGYTAHIPVLPAGQYTLVAVNCGSETINESRNSSSFNVLKAANSVNITVENVLEGCAVTINVTAKVDGNYTLDINGRIENVTVTGGKGNITLLLPAGSYYVNATFNPNYDSNITNATFRVLKTMIEAGDAKYGLNDKYSYQAKLVDEDGNPVSNRTLNFTINGKTINANTDNQGIAEITFTAAVGTYDMTIANNLTDNVAVKVTVLARIAETNDMIMDYDSGKFKVRALGDDGNPVAGETVKMTVNGKKYNVKTDKNGYATLPIELRPKTYTIVSSYKGTTVKNTVKVKSTLKAKKTIKVKRTAKRLILKATLKWSNGKAIAGKIVKFKFRGKTYKAKTNKKGIAKKVLKKKVIKKLKKGRTYKVSIRYKNEYTKTKVKVKK